MRRGFFTDEKWLADLYFNLCLKLLSPPLASSYHSAVARIVVHGSRTNTPVKLLLYLRRRKPSLISKWKSCINFSLWSRKTHKVLKISILCHAHFCGFLIWEKCNNRDDLEKWAPRGLRGNPTLLLDLWIARIQLGEIYTFYMHLVQQYYWDL